MKQTLKEIFAEIGHFGNDIGCNDKGGTHSYIESYDKLLEPYRDGCTLLEIGIAKGDSINLWDKYFENSLIIGADLSIVFEPLQYKNAVELIACDGTSPEFLSHLSTRMFDVIIDDGSHLHQDQVITFNMLKHRMNPGGVFIIEDILNPEVALPILKELHDNCEIIDLRSVKGRFDDVLVIYKF